MIVDLVTSDGQEKIIEAIKTKTEKAIELFKKLNSSVNNYKSKNEVFDKKILLPNF